jgi:hypothetical protein
VATIEKSLITAKSPAILVGLFCILLLFGCQAATPEEVTTRFWQALAQSQIDVAKNQTTLSSQHLVNLQDIDKHSTIKTGEVNADEVNASVVTTINRNNKPITFKTILLKEKNNWKVDFQQTHSNIVMLPFEGIAKSFQELGDTFTNQLEQTVPLIEKEMESLGNELKEQIDEFGRNLKEPENTPDKSKTNPGSI